jgi:hypothetical protein
MSQGQTSETPPTNGRSARERLLFLGIAVAFWFVFGFTNVERVSGFAVAIACSLLFLLMPLLTLAQWLTQSLLPEHARHLVGLGIVALMFSVLLQVTAYRSIALEWFTVALLAVDFLLMTIAIGGALLARLRPSA